MNCAVRPFAEGKGSVLVLQVLTNAQFSIPNSHRMGIEHWELSIGQIVCFLIRDRICENCTTALEPDQSPAVVFGVSLLPHMPKQSEKALARKKAVRRT